MSNASALSYFYSADGVAFMKGAASGTNNSRIVELEISEKSKSYKFKDPKRGNAVRKDVIQKYVFRTAEIYEDKNERVSRRSARESKKERVSEKGVERGETSRKFNDSIYHVEI